MKFTIRAKAAANTSPILVATEDAYEALESVRAFERANLIARIFDDIGRPLQKDDLERFIRGESAPYDRRS